METQFNSPPSLTRIQDSRLAVSGGAMIAAGSLMPFVSSTTAGAYMNPASTHASVIFGLIVVALGFALRLAPRPGRVVVSIVILTLCSLAVLGYVGYIGLGLTGMQQQDPYGDLVTVTYTPEIGIYLAVAGSAVAVVAGIRSFLHHQA